MPENCPATPPVALTMPNCSPSVGVKLLSPPEMPRKVGASVPPSARLAPLITTRPNEPAPPAVDVPSTEIASVLPG
jgi:hypothetical protein